jgi:hypothetical protein
MAELNEPDQIRLFNRREAIRRVSCMLGGAAFIGGPSLLAAVEAAASSPAAGTAAGGATGAFNAQDIAFLDEIAETILPATKTPGAKAAKTGAFMALMVTDSYSAAQRKVFRDGMRHLDDACRKANMRSFMSATPGQRLAVLAGLDREQKQVMDAREAAERMSGLADRDEPPHYFRMMKQLALLGYFTSEIGCTQARRYVEVPGRYDPCIPYTAGEPAWASHA